MRVAGYCRVSSEDQAEGYSLPAQAAAIERWCREQGYPAPDLRIDAGHSAFSDDIAKRPAFAALMADIAARQFDVLVVHKLDRFARSTLVAVQQIRHLHAHGCQLVSLSDNHDFRTAGGQFYFELMSSLAQFDSKQKSERVRGAIAQKRLHGGYHGGYPFGAIHGPDGGLMVDPARADQLRELLTLCAERAPLAVAAAMTARGVPTRRGRGAWRPNAVQSFIKTGAWLLDQPDPWPALYRAARDRPRLPRLPRAGKVNMLTGLMRCACGGAIVYGAMRQRATGERYLECRHYSKDRPKGIGCPIRGKRTAPYYEALVESWLMALPDDLQVAPEDPAIAEARLRIAERRRIAEEVYYDSGDRAAYKARLAALDAEEARLPTPLPLGATTIAAVAEAKRLWPRLDARAKNAVLRVILSKIIICGPDAEVVPTAALQRLLEAHERAHVGPILRFADGHPAKAEWTSAK